MTVAQAPPARAGFFSRRSLVGGTVVAAILLAFGVGLPWLARALPGDDGFRPGQPYPVSAQVFITPAEGWVRDSRRSDLGVTLTMTKGSAEMMVYVREGGNGDVDGELDQLRSTYAQHGYSLGEPQTAQTPSGLTGRGTAGISASSRLQTWVLTNGQQLISVVGTWPESEDVAAEVDAMTASLEVR